MPNNVKLQEGHPVDENLRPLKVGGKATAIETAQHGNGARVTGGLEVSGAGKSIVAEPLITNSIVPTNNIFINILEADLNISATKGLYLDGGDNTYIGESGADVVRHVVGGAVVMILSESGGSGNLVDFGTSCAGFISFQPTYDATTTYVRFNQSGQKGELILDGGNITNLRLLFPNISCNCVLVIKQDGTGSRTITNYETYDQEVGNASTLYFPNGGTSPTLTTTGDGIDILSIYWDNTRHKAYGVMSLDFEASS